MAYDEKTIQAVWGKGKPIQNYDPALYRKDDCGAWIVRKEYGNRNSKYGWEIDHISSNGPDIISNLRPLQWENNLDKSDGRLKCNVVADGTDNIRKR